MSAFGGKADVGRDAATLTTLLSIIVLGSTPHGTTGARMTLPKFPVEGGCQCGAVRYRLKAAPAELHVQIFEASGSLVPSFSVINERGGSSGPLTGRVIQGHKIH